MSKMSRDNKRKARTEVKQQAKQQAQFNSVTNSLKVENQNQLHNTKIQALGPNIDR